VEPKKPKPDDSQPTGRPPGHFMDDKLAEATARFIAEAKRRAERRTRDAAGRDGWDRR
jgi:hypothetical protein